MCSSPRFSAPEDAQFAVAAVAAKVEAVAAVCAAVATSTLHAVATPESVPLAPCEISCF